MQNVGDDRRILREPLIGRRAGRAIGKDYLMGSGFTVADGYLYNMTRWAKRVEMDLSGHPNVTAFIARVEARPKVIEALKAEGLM